MKKTSRFNIEALKIRQEAWKPCDIYVDQGDDQEWEEREMHLIFLDLLFSKITPPLSFFSIWSIFIGCNILLNFFLPVNCSDSSLSNVTMNILSYNIDRNTTQLDHANMIWHLKGFFYFKAFNMFLRQRAVSGSNLSSQVGQ